MVANNPFNSRGFAAIGAREGMLFSDVRLHTRLALRSKNSHIFRPDLIFDQAAPYDPAVLPALGQATSALILRYAGEVSAVDGRHLTFCTHLAAAYAELMEAAVVSDQVLGQLSLASQFAENLGRNPTGDRAEQHLRVAFCPLESGGTVRTFGLAKVGLPEWETAELPSDQQVIALATMEEAATQAFRIRVESGTEPDDLIETVVMGVPMTLRLEKTRNKGVRVRIFQTGA